MTRSGSARDAGGSRGRPVIDRVHRATLERLAEVGFARLSIPDVADLAGVNKTSVYRRWPTKRELVRDAVMSTMGSEQDPPDSGNIRDDMLALARGAAEFVGSPVGMGVLRTLLAEGVALEAEASGGLFGHGSEDAVGRMIDRAVARGELPDGIDVHLLSSTIAGALLHRMVVERQGLSAEYLESLVDLVLDGARSVARPGLTAPDP